MLAGSFISFSPRIELHLSLRFSWTRSEAPLSSELEEKNLTMLDPCQISRLSKKSVYSLHRFPSSRPPRKSYSNIILQSFTLHFYKIDYIFSTDLPTL